MRSMSLSMILIELGSIRKEMYYDDIFMGDMQPATRVSEYCAKILEFCEQDPYLSEEIERERERFLTSRPETYYPTSEERESAELRFVDYFLFSYSSSHYRMSPLELFLSQKLSGFNKKDKKIYSGFKFHIYSAFEVLKIAVGSHFTAKDLPSDKIYKIRENRGTYQLKEGDFIIARILPYEKDYALSHLSLFIPKDASYLVKREWKRMSPKGRKEFDPVLLEKTLYQGGKRKSEDDLKVVEKKLRRKLKEYLGKKAPTIKQLGEKIQETIDPIKVLKQLTEKIDFSTTEEFIEFQELFNLFWNLSPRDEFGGKSPQQKEEEEVKGPKERELTQDLMHYVTSEVDPDRFSSQEDLEKEIERCKNRWLSEPQPELNYRTPRQVILKERKKLGNPQKDFSIKVSVTPIIPKPEIKTNLDNITSRDTSLVKDMEALISYFEQNRVKVTLKNRWIPFNHLKTIERNFKYKDSFAFLGKEEKRGEEPRKFYIHFIDKICRAERFIYVDEKRRINVDKLRVKKFSQKSYGEKLFELLCIWIEKVDWKELQVSDFALSYCNAYQEYFEALLYHLHRLKVNKKITPEKLVNKLFASKIKTIKSQEGFTESLITTLEPILLNYLKWLGIIKTEEEEIIEGTGISTIEKFWIAPAGKRLINRLIEYFIQKGKIKISK
ncbi:MAG: hypothetical protein U9O41_03825 [Candidatus Aerophobetes bacterium]|nr:hypothetical protein [Candidatus Aerophobetes bacterium]